MSRPPTTSDAISLASKLFISAFLMIFLAVAAFIALEVWDDFSNTQAISNEWKQVPTKIIRSEVKPSGDGYQFIVGHRYTWQGFEYESASVHPKYKRDNSYRDAQKRADRYPLGSQATAWVDPEHPANAFLEAGDDTPLIFIILFLSLFSGVPLLILFFVWKPSKKVLTPSVGSSADPAAVASVPAGEVLSSQSRCKDKSAFIMLVLGILFSIAGLAVTAFWSLPFWMELQRLPSYVEVPCVIESSRVRSHSSSDGTTYSIDIVYRYQWQNNTYRGDRYDLLGGSSSGRKSKAAVVARYPARSTSVCFIDPANPANAVLNRDFLPSYFFSALPLIFVAVGLVLLVLFFRKGKSDNALADAASIDGPSEIKPGNPPWKSFLGTLAICLFWNGFIGVFLAVGMEEEEVIILFFMIPFVLVGLVLVGATIYNGMALGNPRFKLALSQASPRLGMPWRIGWQCVGNAARLTSLHIEITGTEVFTYQSGSGKNSRQVRKASTFLRHLVVDTQSPDAIRRGMVELTLPAEGTAPSLDGAACKIEWKITLHGAIHRWPDVQLEFPIQVRPYPAATQPIHT